MKKAYRCVPTAVVAGAAGCLVLCAQIAGCGGDDNQGGPSTDASPTMDGTTPQDAGGGGPDSPVEMADVDAGVMNMPGADADAGTTMDAPSVGDAADAFVCPFTVPTVDQFFSTTASTVCAGLKTCCATGASFDTATCMTVYGTPAYGGFLGVGNVVPYLGSGRIDYDPMAACQCLQGLRTLNCGLIPQNTLSSLQQVCIQAIHGTSNAAVIPDGGDAGGDSGGPCASSYECAAGGFCTVTLPADDAGALGSCKPLVKDGGACSSDLQCSYLTNGVPSLFCGGGSTCQPRFDAGATCAGNAKCVSNVCASPTGGGTSICATGEIFSSSDVCTALTLPGGG